MDSQAQIMENLRTVSDEIAKLAGDEKLTTSGVHKSLCNLSFELEKNIACQELGIGARWTRARKLCEGLINNQHQDNPAIRDVLEICGIPGNPKKISKPK